MDSGIQLSIWKFQTFKRDRIKWFSPQEAHTRSFAALWVSLFTSVEFDGANAFHNRGAPTSTVPPAERHRQPSSPHGTLQTPHNFNQHRKTSNQKDQRASAPGSKCSVMTNSLSGVFLFWGGFFWVCVGFFFGGRGGGKDIQKQINSLDRFPCHRQWQRRDRLVHTTPPPLMPAEPPSSHGPRLRAETALGLGDATFAKEPSLAFDTFHHVVNCVCSGGESPGESLVPSPGWHSPGHARPLLWAASTAPA